MFGVDKIVKALELAKGEIMIYVSGDSRVDQILKLIFKYFSNNNREVKLIAKGKGIVKLFTALTRFQSLNVFPHTIEITVQGNEIDGKIFPVVLAKIKRGYIYKSLPKPEVRFKVVGKFENDDDKKKWFRRTLGKVFAEIDEGKIVSIESVGTAVQHACWILAVIMKERKVKVGTKIESIAKDGKVKPRVVFVVSKADQSRNS